MSKNKEEQLQKIRTNYNIGLEQYQKNNHEVAETQFVKALKPLLSKPAMKALHPENIPAVKAELLDTMYHLGQIYLVNQENKYLDNYSKAAAIFQYCAGFAKKYWPNAENTNSDETEQKQQSNIITDAEYYRDQAYLVEKHFLSSLRVTSAESNDDIYQTQYHNVITSYKDELFAIRELTKEQLSSVANLTLDDISERSRHITEIYRESAQFFINHDDQTKENAISGSGFVQRLLSDCKERLGDQPTGLEFAVIGLGSLANGTITPWSDLEFGILINEDREDYREYCRNLTKLLHIKIINLGETPLRSVGIESLNNFRTTEKSDEWFWDDIIDSGFSFDGPDWYACKYPLGRQGYQVQVIKKEKNALGIEETEIINKPDYALILTPEQLAEFQKELVDGEESNARPSFASDKHLLQALRSVCLIEGDRVLFDKYRDQAEKSESKKILQARSLEILGEDVEKFTLKLGREEEGKLMDVKKTIYRLPDRIINALANYYGISGAEGKPAIDVWEMIDVMQAKELLSKEGAEHLKEATSIAAELRLCTYSNNQSQGESLSTYVPAVGHLTEEEQKKLLHQTFHLKETNLLDYLHHFYYVMLSVQEIVKYFCTAEYHARAEAFLSNDSLYDDGNYSKGMVYARFLEYTQAVQHMEKATNEDKENLEILQQLQFLYGKTGQIEDSINLGKEILKLNISDYKDNPNHPDIAWSYNNLGNAYRDKGEFDAAIRQFNKALKIYKEIYASSPNHSSIAGGYNNLGNAYHDKGGYDTAIKQYNKALEIYKEIYASSLNHPDVAWSYNNLGSVYHIKGEFDAAIEQFNKALDIYKEIYASSPNHPDIATSYNNLGTVHRVKGEFDAAIGQFNKALEIRLVAYASSLNHPSIAGSYNNLGLAYSDKGEYDTAIEQYNKTLKIYKEIYASSPNYPSIAMGYNNLGSVYHIKGEHDAAIEQYNKGLKIYKKAYASSLNHPSIADIYNNLGLVYRLKEEQDAAIKQYNEALDIFKKIYASTDHPSIAASYNNLGLAYSDKGEYGTAIEQFNKALEIRLIAYASSPNHPSIAGSYNNLGSVYHIKGEFDAAIEQYNKALDIYKKAYASSPNHPSIAGSYNNLGLAYSDKGEYGTAIEQQLILLKLDPELRYGNHYHNLACFYECIGNVKETNVSFMKALNHSNVSSGLYAKYAQFLILNRDIGCIASEVEKISQYLNYAISSNNIGGLLTYGIMERDYVCDILRNLIRNKNSEIEINPKILAYYLLTKYPEYIQKGDTIDSVLESFQAYANILQDEISFKLLSNGYELARNMELANVYQEKASIRKKIILGASTLDCIEETDSNKVVDYIQEEALIRTRQESQYRLEHTTEIVEEVDSTKCINNCIISSVTDIIYDNELLNNPELIKILANKYGMNKAIDIGSLLSLDLINKVIENNDHELLLAGALSVQQEYTE